jgi:hypothetical protein
MHGWQSLNLELTPLDPDLERNLRRSRRTSFEMEDNPRDAQQEEHDEYQDARAGHVEQIRAYDVDFTTSLRELFTPVETSSHSCIVLPPTNATHFNLKPHIIQLLPSFHGLAHESPYGHVKTKDICAMFKFQNFSEESVDLRLFPFSLQGRARAWLDSNTPRSITSWESLLTKFYSKFFLMSAVKVLKGNQFVHTRRG